MPPELNRAVAPALAGHAFQQAALVGMLPLLADRLHLAEAQIGTAVAVGMLAAAAALPLVGLRTGRSVLRLSCLGLLGSSLALTVLIAAPPASAGVWVLPTLVAIRVVQGVGAGALLIAAQQQGAAADRPLGGLARAQSFVGAGRLLGALLLGPMLMLAAVAPVLPAVAGTLLSLARSAKLPCWRRSRERMAAPLPRMLVTPAVVQAATGAAQIGLAPLLADRLAVRAEVASGYAGLCLAAATFGLLATHRWITARLGPATLPLVRRICPLAMASAALLLPLCDRLPSFAVLSAVIGGTGALLLVVNLSEAVATSPKSGGQASGWNGATQIGALAIGVGLGSLVMPFSPAAPFAVSAALAFSLAIAPGVRRRSLR